jgi:acyl carrier protein
MNGTKFITVLFCLLILTARASGSDAIMQSSPRMVTDDEVILGKVKQIMADKLGIGRDTVVLDTKFEDFGADELDRVEIVLALEDEFQIEIPDEYAKRIQTPADAFRYVRRSLSAFASEAPTVSPPTPRRTNLFLGQEKLRQVAQQTGGTATRKRPRPQPAPPVPAPDQERAASELPSKKAATPGFFGELVMNDSTLRQAYQDALHAYYKAVQAQNRVDEATFTQLGSYNNWSLENRQRTIERQQFAAMVVLAVVVFLVLTGVVFSGIQFYIAMRHSRFEAPAPATTLKASLNSIEVSSSILGVIILAISLLFFYFYLDRVFSLAVLPD